MKFQKISAIGDKVTLTTIYDDPIANYETNYYARMENYRKMTNGKTMIPISSIPKLRLEELIAKGDMDAIAFDAATDDAMMRAALRRLLARFPEFRVSEASI